MCLMVKSDGQPSFLFGKVQKVNTVKAFTASLHILVAYLQVY